LRNFISLALLSYAPALTAQTLRTSPHGDLQAACDLCHHPDSWEVSPQDVKFDHAATAFPLEGRHRNASCRSCHNDLNFSSTGTECASCHQDVHKGDYGIACSRCHSPAGWNDLDIARRNHDRTRLPLTGPHRQLACEVCHRDGQFAGTAVACKSCHLDKWTATSAPVHRAVGFGTDCESCHTPNLSWLDQHFAHTPNFPLSGGHKVFRCEICHTNGSYTGLSADCFSCHSAAYNEASNPTHIQAGFGHDCRTCHTIDGWSPSLFDHAHSGFPLTGDHKLIRCESCHAGGRYAGLPLDCYGCHRTDYDRASDPNHVTVGFPTTCLTCHSTENWRGRFDHDGWFPIYSGRHNGRWQKCSECHENPAEYRLFTCTDCHLKGPTQSRHGEVRDFVFDSAACYRCHPRGSAED
jgi:hypothetical protein